MRQIYTINKSAAKKKKATKDEIGTRISEIIKFILEGRSNNFIVQYCEGKYHLGNSQIYENIREAHRQLAQINCSNVYLNYTKSLAIKYELLEQAMQGKNLDLSLKILLAIDRQSGVEENATMIKVNMDTAMLFYKNMIKEFLIANESSNDVYERQNRFLIALRDGIHSIFEQASPLLAYQEKQLELENKKDDDEDEEEAKPIDCTI